MIFIYSARLGHLTLQPCCALTNGPFLAFNGSNWLLIWILGISSIFKFENWLDILGTVTFWKLGVFGKIPKLMKSEDVKIDFSGHFLFQIFATDKPLEIDPWNQMQMIPWDLHFCRKKVPSENINPSLRKPYGPIWRSKIQNSPHMFVLVGDVCGASNLNRVVYLVSLKLKQQSVLKYVYQKW